MIAPTMYELISDLPANFVSDDAKYVETLGQSWRDRLKTLEGTKALKEFEARLYREWAIETGIIERIYSLDVGTTKVLVEHGLHAALIPHGASDQSPERVIRIVESQRSAIDAILDQIAQKRGLTAHFIRSLHEVITHLQIYVDGVDQFGNVVQVPLVHGAWKTQPNNPTTLDGALHLYCPPELVQSEMDRLVGYYKGLTDRRVNALIRAAWLHHRFTRIHPFQDGNGRVARALTAYVLVEAGLFPIVVRRDDRPRYILTLENADNGDLLPLVKFFSECEQREISAALSLIDETIAGPAPVSPIDAVLLSAKERIIEREQAQHEKQLQVLSTADELFVLMQTRVGRIRDELREKILSKDYMADVQVSTPETTHWFRFQIGTLAKSLGYFADMDIYHQWARLRIRRANLGQSEIVFSIHGLGRPFSGVMAVNAYFAVRDFTDGEGGNGGEVTHIANAPLSFTFREERDEVRRRFATWLDEVLVVGLEEWRREL